jgi:hypothetical protein
VRESYPECEYVSTSWTERQQCLRVIYVPKKDIELIVGLEITKSWCVFSHEYDAFNLIETCPCSDPNFVSKMAGVLKQQRFNLNNHVYHSC